ncbi:Uncharacterized protein TCM_034683 [Theobroma cacao]|uniref:Uncharacterized protein n=1 Tax=Theobroma cacao TaxID=3641 RepID=A0A061FF97_THECC|nr:Uncharacterized protein TCM_034683 [Theobroma cacao]
MKHERKFHEVIFLSLGFYLASILFGSMWFMILPKMDTKHLKESLGQILLVLVSYFMFGIVVGLILPLVSMMGCASLTSLFNYPSELYSSDNAECKETRFPVWFTAPAYILCCILIRISWTLLNDYCGKLLKRPEEDGFLVVVPIISYSLGFTHSLVLALCFGFCILWEIAKKSSKSVKMSPISDIESVQSKS